VKAKIYKVTQGNGSEIVLGLSRKDAIESADLRTMGTPKAEIMFHVRCDIHKNGYVVIAPCLEHHRKVIGLPSQYLVSNEVDYGMSY
tara:strand:+ start:386 stop:646 length:261 start_codon:yes stop_codon:yes gene_type:complete